MEEKNLGRYIKSMREKAHLNQEELAEKINVNTNKIVKWERNQCFPELEEMYKISEIFQVPCKELLEYKEKELEKSRNIIEKISKALGISAFAVIAFIVAVFVFGLVFAFMYIQRAGTYVNYM